MNNFTRGRRRRVHRVQVVHRAARRRGRPRRVRALPRVAGAPAARPAGARSDPQGRIVDSSSRIAVPGDDRPGTAARGGSRVEEPRMRRPSGLNDGRSRPSMFRADSRMRSESPAILQRSDDEQHARDAHPARGRSLDDRPRRGADPRLRRHLPDDQRGRGRARNRRSRRQGRGARRHRLQVRGRHPRRRAVDPPERQPGRRGLGRATRSTRS